MYRRIQVFYHHFLTSSIAVLFVASTHAPVSFSAQCRKEFNMALELIKDLSPKSWVSQRLWRTVKSLKAYAPKLGLQQDDTSQSRESTTLAMTGTATGGQSQNVMSNASTHRGSISSAGHQPTPSPALTPGYGGQSGSTRIRSLTPHGGGTSPLPTTERAQSSHGKDTTSPDDQNNGIRLQTEMLRMYEGFGSGVGQVPGGADEIYGGTMGEYPPAGGHYGMAGDGEGVYPLMKEMF